MKPGEWRAWQKVLAAMRKNPLGGVCANDGYNVQTFGITAARFRELQRVAEDLHGMDWRQATQKDLRNA